MYENHLLVPDEYAEVIYKAELKNAGTFTVIVTETSEGYLGGFSATQNMVIQVKEWEPCKATGFIPVHPYFEPTLIYYAQSDSTMNITLGGVQPDKKTMASYQDCGFEDEVRFTCDSCGLDSDGIKQRIIF